MSSEIEIAKNTVLSSKMLFLAHPGNSKLSEYYPNPSNCTAHVAEALNQHGSYRVSFNQAQFGASQTAIVSCSNLLNNLAIVMVINPVDNTTVAREAGWGFDAIDQVQFSFSNSLMQDIAIPGPLLREYALYLCKDEAERRDLLEAAGTAFNGITPGGVAHKTAVVPLNFLSFIGTQHAFPLDLSVLSSGTVQIRATLRAANQVFAVDAAGALAVPNQLVSMDIITSTSVLMQSAFSVRNAMINEPQTIYSLPAKYLNWYKYDIAAGQDIYANPYTIQLSSLPSGQLEAMFVVVRSKRANANPERIADTNLSGGLPFKALRLTYGTLTIYESRSLEERRYYMKSVFDDDMMYYTVGWRTRYLATPNPPDAIAVNGKICRTIFPYQVAVIPFTHKGSQVKSGAFMENLPSYGGSQLTLTFQAEPVERLIFANDVAPLLKTSTTRNEANALDANGYDVYVGYVLSGILALSNGTIDLQI